jgi:hypothetical protein
MLKHTITYEDVHGDEITEDFYFNINEAEMIELEVEHKEGMYAWLDRIVKSEDRKTLVSEFKKIILAAYGVKSEDGKRFIKNDEVREAFVQTDAYSKLFMQLATDAEFGATFVKGVLPKKMASQVDEAVKAQEQAQKTDPPTTNS